MAWACWEERQGQVVSLKALFSAGKPSGMSNYCLYPVTPPRSPSALPLESQWYWQSHTWGLCLLCTTPQEKGIYPVGSFCLLTAKEVREGCISNATLINVSHTVTVTTLEQSANNLWIVKQKKIVSKSETHLHNTMKLNYETGDGRRELHVLLLKYCILTNV